MTRSLEETLWTATLQHYTAYGEDELLDIVIALAEIRYNIDNTRLKSVVLKYSADEYCNAAEVSALRVRNLRFDSDFSNQSLKLKQQAKWHATNRHGANSVFSEFLV